MADNTTHFLNAIPEKSPSVYRLWQIAQERGESDGEKVDIYRALLEEFGHRSEGTGKW